jgi:hypothetical protein
VGFSRNRVRERLSIAAERLVGVRLIKREVPKAVQRARELLVEAELACARRRLLEKTLTFFEVATVAVRLAQPLELVQA